MPPPGSAQRVPVGELEAHQQHPLVGVEHQRPRRAVRMRSPSVAVTRSAGSFSPSLNALYIS